MRDHESKEAAYSSMLEGLHSMLDPDPLADDTNSRPLSMA